WYSILMTLRWIPAYSLARFRQEPMSLLSSRCLIHSYQSYQRKHSLPCLLKLRALQCLGLSRCRTLRQSKSLIGNSAGSLGNLGELRIKTSTLRTTDVILEVDIRKTQPLGEAIDRASWF